MTQDELAYTLDLVDIMMLDKKDRDRIEQEQLIRLLFIEKGIRHKDERGNVSLLFWGHDVTCCEQAMGRLVGRGEVRKVWIQLNQEEGRIDFMVPGKGFQAYAFTGVIPEAKLGDWS